MRRIAIVLVIVSAFIFQGCEAFKDHYDAPPQDVLENLGAEIEQGEPSVDGGEKIKDYSIDETPCENNSAITVSFVPDVAQLVNSGWTTEDVSEVKIIAFKKGVFTTEYSIMKTVDQLKFTLKQVDDAAFHICDVSYNGCDGECVGTSANWKDVAAGQVEVHQFNNDTGNSVVINAGAFNIDFNESSMGDAGLSIEGSYVVDALGETVISLEEKDTEEE